uniref:Dynein heavy chain tail domain-containing protein n=1 Tax=Periophthalmus magnuspinnatus TaxID=409849 RepID=A0A3B3ZTL0_9GOBI
MDMMDPKDERLDPLMNFTIKSFRLDPEKWRVSEEEGMRVEHGPTTVETEAVPGDDALGLFIALTEELALPLIGNGKNCSDWPQGMQEEMLRQMKLLKKQALVVQAQTQGRIFLPQCDLHEDACYLERSLDQKDQSENNLGDIILRSTIQSKDLQACESTIIEWAELVDEFLKQDSSELLLERTRPMPIEEFNFWESRLENLVFIDKKLKSTKAQQVVAIVENAESVYAPILQQVYSSVQSALNEAEDITRNLKPLQELLEKLQTMDYPQLRDQVETMMKEVLLLWTRSQFYCKPCRIVVLIQEICNLFIELSRSFLGRGQVLKGLLSDPAPVLESVCLCIATLERLKECFRDCRAELDTQGGNNPKWDFPSMLIFIHLDQFLKRLDNIREGYRVTLDMAHLDQAILGGINGKKWTGLIQNKYTHFFHHMTILAKSKCDATDCHDQEFPELWAQFDAQVKGIENSLVDIFSSALQTCTISTSAGKIVLMFGAVLRRPLILNNLHCHFNSVWNMILTEVNQTEHLTLLTPHILLVCLSKDTTIILIVQVGYTSTVQVFKFLNNNK